MSVNNMSFEQSAAVLQAMYNYVTGQTISTPVNSGDFTSVATTLLQAGPDPILRSINQIITETIFAVRPYDAQLRGMEVDSQYWGGVVRKLNFLDKKISADPAFPMDADLTHDPTLIKDMDTIDMYVQNKPAVVQTNFYGGDVYADWITIYEEGHYGLQTAFQSPAQFSAFWSAILTQMQNKLEQFVEAEKRLCLVNMIGGRIAENADANLVTPTFSTNKTSMIYLLTEYKTATGNSTISVNNWRSDAEIRPFIKWLYAYLNTLVKFMGERTLRFHTNLDIGDYTGKGLDPTAITGLMRFTRPRDMHCYLMTEVSELIRSMVLSSTYNDDMLRMLDYDTINFWQDPDSPFEINATVTAFDEFAGDVETNLSVNQDNIAGIIWDRDAMGVTLLNEATYQTPFNAAGRYTNQWFHRVVKWWNDFTENSIVLIMDEKP